MKNHLLTAMMALGISVVSAQSFPQPSPRAKVSQTVGLTNIEIEYSRPAINKREIFGKLLPFGEVWRMGANSSTKITFDDAVNFGGTNVPAGAYAMLAIPNEGAITVMLNRDVNANASKYDKTTEVAVVKARLEKSPEFVERMRLSIEDMTSTTAVLVLAWGEQKFQIPITVETDKRAEANMKEKLDEFDSQFAFYNEASAYYLSTGKDPRQALEWSQKSVGMKSTFWNIHTLAKAYQANGDSKNAKTQAERSMVMAREANNKAYQDMNAELIKTL